jgi:hypothetical protein
MGRLRTKYRHVAVPKRDGVLLPTILFSGPPWGPARRQIPSNSHADTVR